MAAPTSILAPSDHLTAFIDYLLALHIPQRLLRRALWDVARMQYVCNSTHHIDTEEGEVLRMNFTYRLQLKLLAGLVLKMIRGVRTGREGVHIHAVVVAAVGVICIVHP